MQATWKLSIRPEIRGPAMILTLAGRIGVGVSHQFHAALVNATSNGHRHLVLDLTGVDYMSSAGVSALEDACRRLRSAGRHLILCGVREPVRLVLDMTGLCQEVVVDGNVEAALARLEGDKTS